MLESSYYKEKGIKLRIYFDRGWVITGDSDFYPGDRAITGWMGISIEDYKEMLKNFNRKQIKKIHQEVIFLLNLMLNKLLNGLIP